MRYAWIHRVGIALGLLFLVVPATAEELPLLPDLRGDGLPLTIQLDKLDKFAPGRVIDVPHFSTDLQIDCLGMQECCLPFVTSPTDCSNCMPPNPSIPDCNNYVWGLANPEDFWGVFGEDCGRCSDPDIGAICDAWGATARFTAPHRIRLNEMTIGLHDTDGQAEVPLDIYVWADDGGQRPDTTVVLGGPITVTPDTNDGGSYGVYGPIDISAYDIVLEPYQDFHVGAEWEPYYPRVDRDGDTQIDTCPGPAGSPQAGTSLFYDGGMFPFLQPERFIVGPRNPMLTNIYGMRGWDPCYPAPSWGPFGAVGMGSAKPTAYWVPVIRFTVECIDSGGATIACETPEMTPDPSRRFADETTTVGLDGIDADRSAWGDFDGDGDDDLLINGFQLMENQVVPSGTATFVDITLAAGLNPGANGGIWADLDNDGDLDIFAFAGTTGQQAVYENNGDGTVTFYGETLTGLVDNASPTEAAAVGDVNGDGLVDIYLANYEDCAQCPLPDEFLIDGGGECTDSCDTSCYSGDNPCLISWGSQDRLYLNNGDFTFTDATVSSGIEAYQAIPIDLEDTNGDTFRDFVPAADPANPDAWEYFCGRGVVMADLDNDGDLDIYLANYRLDPNFLWENQGDGTFVERAFDYAIEGENTNMECDLDGDTVPDWNAWGHGIGPHVGDINHDGLLDLAVGQLAHSPYRNFSDRSRIWLGDPAGFSDITTTSGIPYYETDSVSSFADYDNDGWQDLLISAVNSGSDSRGWMTHAWRNNGDNTFTYDSYPSELFVEDVFQGLSWCDIETTDACENDPAQCDGDLDVYLRSAFYMNRTTDTADPGENWIQVKVRGCTSSRDGIGSKVSVTAGGETQLRQVLGGYGGGSQDSLVQHFGLGTNGNASDITVTFPSGQVQSRPGGPAPANRRYSFLEVGAVITGPSRVCVGGQERFDSDNCGNTIDNYRWECGDDDPPLWNDGILPQSNLCDFPAFGTQTVRLEVTSGAVTQESQKVVIVEEAPTFTDFQITEMITCAGSGAVLDWSATPAVFNNATATGTYSVYRADWDGAACGAYTLLSDPAGIPMDTFTFDDDTTVAGNRYCYRVAAEDSTPNSACVPQGPVNGGAVTQVDVENWEDTDNPDAIPLTDVGNYFMYDLATDRWDWSEFVNDPNYPTEPVLYWMRRSTCRNDGNGVCRLVCADEGAWENVFGGFPPTATTSLGDVFPPQGVRLVFYAVRTVDECDNVSRPFDDLPDPWDCRPDWTP
jgi:hypothetical protein